MADRIVLTAAELRSLQSGGIVQGWTAAGLVKALAGMTVKDASDPADPNPVEGEHVYNQLLANYPPRAISWVKDPSIRWIGPVEIPLERVNTSDESSWAASHQAGAVARFAGEMKAGTGHTNPVVMVQKPGENKAEVIDGHHRFLACRKLGWPCKAYMGFVPRDEGPWDETHSAQLHQGSDPANKATLGRVRRGEDGALYGYDLMGDVRGRDPDEEPKPVLSHRYITMDEARQAARKAKDSAPPVAAGLAVRAANTGRILMLQRAMDEDGEDPAGGFWEFPGGRLDDGEDALTAARREFQEETGCKLPADGDLDGLWNSSNGKYRGFVLTVPDEDCVPIFGDRDEVDDPDGDHTEALAWWDPAQLKDNPAIRPELAEDQKRVRRALKAASPPKGGGLGKSAQTPVVSTVHHPLGRQGLWHTPSKKVPVLQQLPAYLGPVLPEHGQGADA